MAEFSMLCILVPSFVQLLASLFGALFSFFPPLPCYCSHCRGRCCLFIYLIFSFSVQFCVFFPCALFQIRLCLQWAKYKPYLRESHNVFFSFHVSASLVANPKRTCRKKRKKFESTAEKNIMLEKLTRDTRVSCGLKTEHRKQRTF